VKSFVRTAHDVWGGGNRFQAAGVSTLALDTFPIDCDVSDLTREAGRSDPELAAKIIAPPMPSQS